MSVVVLDTEMPAGCETCKMNTKDAFGGLVCRVKNLIPIRKQNEAAPKWCPLRPLPEKHGDLIDREQLVGRFVPRQAYFTDAIKEKIETAPTIIEAEGE